MEDEDDMEDEEQQDSEEESNDKIKVKKDGKK